jgi:hypothetical protein
MILIDTVPFKNAEFTLNSAPTEAWYFLGFGENPTSGAPYVFGQLFDSVNNRTTVATHLLKNITFKGKLSK